MRDELAALLACPHCGRPLARAGAAVRCPVGHAFDVARQGYVALLAGEARGGGDTAAMVAARQAVAAAGHLEPLAAAVADVAARELAGGPPGAVVDLGAGPGHHLARVLDAAPGRLGLALDISAAACRRAARAHPRAGAVRCDVWRGLPVRSGAAALVLDVFAPRNGPEIRRVLHPEGVLVAAWPAPGHLRELVGALGLLAVDPRKEQRAEAALRPHLVPGPRERVEWTMALSRADAERLAAMGPSAWHLDPAELRARAAALPEPIAATGAVDVTVHRPR